MAGGSQHSTDMPELPWDFLFVMGTIAVTVILPVILLVGMLDLKKRRMKALQSPQDSLTTSELQDLIENAVSRANDELVHRLDRLERHLLTPRPQERSTEEIAAGTRVRDEQLEDKPRTIGRLRSPSR